jgi:enoyl-CoA hydratase/carnithine racemase
MSSPAAADLAAAGMTLTFDGPVVTLGVAVRDQATQILQTVADDELLVQVGRSLPGSVRLIVVRVRGGSGRSLPLAEPALSARRPPSVNISNMDFLSYLVRPDVLAVASLDGHVSGLALRLALACDLRVLAADTRLALAGPGSARLPPAGTSRPLVAAAGYSRVLDMCLTGRAVDAGEALRVGLADRVVPLDDLEHATRDLVGALLAVPRDVAAEVKALLLHTAEGAGARHRQAERDAHLRVLAGE